MGFTIFESSGTFNPRDYGLVVGDLIHLIVVGGGGGGAGAANLFTAGTAGGASSFGSILTAAGGLAPSDNNAVTPTTGSFRGSSGVQSQIGFYLNDAGAQAQVSQYSVFAGGGADGWLPGVCKGRSGIPSTIFAYSSPSWFEKSLVNISQDSQGHAVQIGFHDALLVKIPASNQMAGTGGVYVAPTHNFITNALAISGCGGIGYGAGGGGGCCTYVESGANYYNRAAAGGNSGVIAQKDFVLTSMSPVSVTVGTGGKGGSGYGGGDGANGCVAIFW